MIERRDLLKFGVAAPLALALPARLMAAPAGISALLVDTRYPDLMLRAIVPVEARVHGFDGDVTPLWTGLLDAAWREQGHIVAGMTGQDALFVLEHLAWDRGRRVTHRALMANASAGRPALVQWLIEPVHPSVKA